ncbi:MAG: hypothetical protein K1X55_04150 [Chitinophagales bacterium]|nr:hypothetical protein [Chitinophagales bacterium]
MKKFLFVIVCIILLMACKKETTTNSTDKHLIWHGFHHIWDYNHRINRLGDWYEITDSKDGLKVDLVHAAASGSGADKLNYSSFYTLVTSEKIHTFQNKFSFRMYGKEGETVEAAHEVSGHLPDYFDRNMKYAMLIAGLDKYSRTNGVRGDGKADKIYDFELKLLPITVMDNGDFSFDIQARLAGDCSSPECLTGPEQDWFDYQVTCYYQIVAFDGNLVSDTLYNTYSWEKPSAGRPNPDDKEIFRDAHMIAKKMVGSEGYDQAILGFNSISYRLEKGLGGLFGNTLEYQHMLETDIAINKAVYDEETGEMDIVADLFFKNWDATMPPVSYGGGGSVAFKAGLTMLQWNDSEGKIEPITQTGSISWNTSQNNQQPGNSPASLSVVNRNF